MSVHRQRVVRADGRAINVVQRRGRTCRIASPAAVAAVPSVVTRRCLRRPSRKRGCGVHEVTYLDATHLYQRRASCCRIYLLPRMELCASCPLVSQEERLARRAWMKTQLERQRKERGHA